MGQYLVHMSRTTGMSCNFLYCDHCEKGLTKTSPLLKKSMYAFWMRYRISFIHQTELNCLGIREGGLLPLPRLQCGPVVYIYNLPKCI